MQSEWQEEIARLLHGDQEIGNKECPYCGDMFKPKWVKPDANHCLGRWQVYCSQTCAKLWWEEKRDDSEPTRTLRHRGLPPAANRPEKEKRKGISETITEIRKTLPRAYKNWSPEEEELLCSDFVQGQKIKDIAKRLQRNTGGIRSRLIKLGLIEKDSPT